MLFYQRDLDPTGSLQDDRPDDAYYALHDLNGNVVMLLDDTGALKETYHDSPYGTVKAVPYLYGDFDEDGAAGTTPDFGIFALSFGKNMGTDDGYDARADENRDGAVGVTEYGHFVSSSGHFADEVPPGAISAYGNTIGYAGYVWEPNLGGNDSGMYQVRFRWYVVALGRWANSDPARYIDGMNLFEYGGDDPLTMIDPLGLDFWDGVDNTVDVVAGWGDEVSGGATRRIRDAIGLGVYVRYDSDWYDYGAVAGDVGSFLPGVSIVTEWGSVITLSWDLAQAYLQKHPGSYASGYSCSIAGGGTGPQLPPKTIVPPTNGVTIVHYYRSGETEAHGPHVHVKGGGREVRIGQNGKPVKGEPELSPKQRSVVRKNKGVIRKAVKKIMKWFRRVP